MIFLAFIEENRRLWKGSCDPPKKSYSGWDVSCQGISSKGSLKEDKGTLKNISHRLKGLVMLETSRKEEWWVRFPGCNLGRPQSTESNLVQLKNARSEDRGYTQDTALCPKSRPWMAFGGNPKRYCRFYSNRILPYFPLSVRQQAWHLNFSQLFDDLGHENNIFSESISSRGLPWPLLPPDHLDHPD